MKTVLHEDNSENPRSVVATQNPTPLIDSLEVPLTAVCAGCQKGGFYMILYHQNVTVS